VEHRLEALEEGGWLFLDTESRIFCKFPRGYCGWTWWYSPYIWYICKCYRIDLRAMCVK